MAPTHKYQGLTMQLVLISGLSGSGKSVALNVMEDSGH
ncbi:MAG: RNase adapter RapZ, partial [Zoogloea sp.]